MAKKISSTLREVGGPPKGEPFVCLTFEFFNSDAWRTAGINCRRLVEALICEHLSHAGKENGFLMYTYEQFERAGINRRFIYQSIKEAEERGLIRVEHGFRRKGIKELSPNVYTLTFQAVKNKGGSNGYYYTSPTNDWKRFKN